MTIKTLPIAVLGLLLTLTACVSTVDATTQPSASPSATADTATTPPEVDRNPQNPLPEVTFDANGIPTMAVLESDPPTTITVQTLQAGDGATVADGDYVTVNYAGFLWSDGTQFDSSYDTGTPAGFPLNNVVDGWRYGLAGTKVGDRLVVVVPPAYGYGEQGSQSVPGGATLVFVVDILDTKTVTTDALTAATPTGATLPEGLTITGELGQEPTLTMAAGAPAPTKSEVIVLAEGTGATITDTDTLLYHVVGGYWGTETTSTWPNYYQGVASGGGPETIGQQVGARLLLLFPADQENGTAAQALVLDLLAVIPTK